MTPDYLAARADMRVGMFLFGRLSNSSAGNIEHASRRQHIITTPSGRRLGCKLNASLATMTGSVADSSYDRVTLALVAYAAAMAALELCKIVGQPYDAGGPA